MKFLVNGEELCFGMKEYALVTYLKFWRFPTVETIFNQVEECPPLRIINIKLLRMVKNINTFLQFPWGKLFFRATLKGLNKDLKHFRSIYLDKKKATGKKKKEKTVDVSYTRMLQAHEPVCTMITMYKSSRKSTASNLHTTLQGKIVKRMEVFEEENILYGGEEFEDMEGSSFLSNFLYNSHKIEEEDVDVLVEKKKKNVVENKKIDKRKVVEILDVVVEKNKKNDKKKVVVEKVEEDKEKIEEDKDEYGNKVNEEYKDEDVKKVNEEDKDEDVEKVNEEGNDEDLLEEKDENLVNKEDLEKVNVLIEDLVNEMVEKYVMNEKIEKLNEKIEDVVNEMVEEDIDDVHKLNEKIEDVVNEMVGEDVMNGEKIEIEDVVNEMVEEDEMNCEKIEKLKDKIENVVNEMVEKDMMNGEKIEIEDVKNVEDVQKLNDVMDKVYPLVNFDPELLEELMKELRGKNEFKMLELNTGSVGYRFFNTMLMKAKWLTNEEINSACFLLRKRETNYPKTYTKDFAIADGLEERHMLMWSTVNDIYVPLNLEFLHWIASTITNEEFPARVSWKSNAATFPEEENEKVETEELENHNEEDKDGDTEDVNDEESKEMKYEESNKKEEESEEGSDKIVVEENEKEALKVD
ncbi:MATH and LRR domain-containing protein PFE0570w-like [Impatiens glandulifera]|uniref:MATH and LRR domain-containing protein PFE0570w-like n=1 Tax=Impatiens glandulifera TaxID=253017 RepID=UPI001FB074A8|nr:MATH and LRR domain-containing protein PFE0570w-like [Impatiens glandulifera]